MWRIISVAIVGVLVGLTAMHALAAPPGATAAPTWYCAAFRVPEGTPATAGLGLGPLPGWQTWGTMMAAQLPSGWEPVGGAGGEKPYVVACTTTQPK